MNEQATIDDQLMRTPSCGASSSEPPPSYFSNVSSEPAGNEYRLPIQVLSRASVHLDTRAAWPGGFLSGQLFVVPSSVTPVAVLEICVVKTEKAYRPRGLGKREKVSMARKIVTSTQFPISETLSPDRRYYMPFSLKLPPSLGHAPCSCGVESSCELSSAESTMSADGHPCLHCDLPPSIGEETEVQNSLFRVTITYAVKARILNTSLSASQQFKMHPDPSDLNLDNYVDGTGRKLSRTRHLTLDWCRKNFIGKSQNIGQIMISCNPLYHDLTRLGQHHATVSINLIPQGNKRGPAERQAISEFAISKVKVSIYKSVLSNHHGIKNVLDSGRSSAATLRSFKIPGPDMCVGFQVNTRDQSRSELLLTVFYKVQTTMGMSTPSFVSCLSAVSYELALEIKHTFGTSTFHVPVVSRGDALPSYGNISGELEQDEPLEIVAPEPVSSTISNTSSRSSSTSDLQNYANTKMEFRAPILVS